MEIKIEIPNEIVVESRGQTVTFDVTKVPEDKIAELASLACEVGFKKTGIDSGSSAKKYGEENGMTIEEATVELIGKRIAVWEDTGDWGASRSGLGLTTLDKEMIALCRPKVQAMLGEAVYKALDDKDAKIMEYIAGLNEKARNGLAKFAQSEIDRKAAAKARRAELDLPDFDLEA